MYLNIYLRLNNFNLINKIDEKFRGFLKGEEKPFDGRIGNFAADMQIFSRSNDPFKDDGTFKRFTRKRRDTKRIEC